MRVRISVTCPVSTAASTAPQQIAGPQLRRVYTDADRLDDLRAIVDRHDAATRPDAA